MNIKEKSRSYEKSSGTFKYNNQANETKRQTAKFELNLPSKNRYSIIILKNPIANPIWKEYCKRQPSIVAKRMYLLNSNWEISFV